jgi:hypothetical protein
MINAHDFLCIWFLSSQLSYLCLQAVPVTVTVPAVRPVLTVYVAIRATVVQMPIVLFRITAPSVLAKLALKATQTLRAMQVKCVGMCVWVCVDNVRVKIICSVIQSNSLKRVSAWQILTTSKSNILTLFVPRHVTLALWTKLYQYLLTFLTICCKFIV